MGWLAADRQSWKAHRSGPCSVVGSPWFPALQAVPRPCAPNATLKHDTYYMSMTATGSAGMAWRAKERKWKMHKALLVLLILLVVAGCEDPYYAGRPAYGPGYVAGPGPGPAIAVEIGDRPYYNRGPGYYVGSRYYVWRRGHWRHRHGRRVWVHGHYVLR